MKDSAYAYAVARVRANEPKLMTAKDMEQLISARDLKAALRMLEDKGWNGCQSYDDLNAVMLERANETWNFLCEIAPDISELDFLIIKNDFHNMKTALKAFVSNDSFDSFLSPSIISSELIRSSVTSHHFDALPKFARDAVGQAYQALVRTYDGQLADIMLDRMALNAIREVAGRTEIKFITDLAELILVTANLKTALRASLTGKDRFFLETALCEAGTISKNDLIDASLKGTDGLLSYISSTNYEDAAKYIKISSAAFEKWCDDIIMQHMTGAKYVSLGVQPLIAYYIAREAEIKNVRIILSCKHNNIPSEMIKERMRTLYA